MHTLDNFAWTQNPYFHASDKYQHTETYKCPSDTEYPQCNNHTVAQHRERQFCADPYAHQTPLYCPSSNPPPLLSSHHVAVPPAQWHTSDSYSLGDRAPANYCYPQPSNRGEFELYGDIAPPSHHQTSFNSHQHQSYHHQFGQNTYYSPVGEAKVKKESWGTPPSSRNAYSGLHSRAEQLPTDEDDNIWKEWNWGWNAPPKNTTRPADIGPSRLDNSSGAGRW
ncbi:hypothetical protein E1B28_005395 [Marasmius oreades]|uniref:Uncharacterized protein n=1 Tax=Marasmius oreades TaxID=181124 RepID=A0A9P7S3S0_9AGAR|nr:uncharacterized protein E1B28_005395 [Marasmius oreades]KAG7094567.1 hypothetical protein E1B28_005395 [Marasmius oreades]